MNNDELTTENFWAIFNSLEPIVPTKRYFRLYYDDAGKPLFYTNEDLPGNYIDVTPEQCRDSNMNVRVRNGQLLELGSTLTQKIIPNGKGIPCHPGDVTIVVQESQEHIKWSQRVFNPD